MYIDGVKIDNRGSSLLLAVFVVSLLGIILLSLLGLLHRETLITTARGHRISAFYRAEAGLRKVQWDIINAGYNWPYPGEKHDLTGDIGGAPEGNFQVCAVKNGAEGGGSVGGEAGEEAGGEAVTGTLTVTVESTGQAGEIKCSLRSVLKVEAQEGEEPHMTVEKWEETTGEKLSTE